MRKFRKVNTVERKKIEEWFNKRYQKLWITLAVGLVLSIIISVCTAWNPMHKFFCSLQPNNTMHNLVSTLHEFNSQNSIVNGTIHTETKLSSFENTIESTKYSTDIKFIQAYWNESSDQIVFLFGDSVVNRKQVYDFSKFNGKSENLVQIERFITEFILINPTLFSNVSTEELLILIKERINKHSNGPLKSSCSKLHGILWFISSFMRTFILGFASITLWLRLKYFTQMSEIHKEYALKYKYRFSKPNFVYAFKVANPNWMVENYQALLDEEVKTFKKIEQQLRRKAKKEKIFLDKATNLLNRIAEEFDNNIPGTMHRYLAVVIDFNGKSLVERNNALVAAENEFYNSAGGNRQTLTRSNDDELMIKRDTLHREVQLKIDGPIEEGCREAVEQCWQIYTTIRNEEPARLVKQIYYLQQALLVKSTEEINSPANDTFEAPQLQKDVNSIVYLADVVDQFSVHKHLPKNIPHQYVTAIVIWGLLKPGQRGTTYVNEKYLRDTNLRADVSRKIGSTFNPAVYSTVLEWLLDQRIVLKPKRTQHHNVYSLNPHANEATPLGAKIVNSIIAFRQVLESTLT